MLDRVGKAEDPGESHIFLDGILGLFLTLPVTLDFAGPISPIVK